MTSRRSFIGSILAAASAPAIVKAEIIMPVRRIWTPEPPHALMMTRDEWEARTTVMVAERWSSELQIDLQTGLSRINQIRLVSVNGRGFERQVCYGAWGKGSAE